MFIKKATIIFACAFFVYCESAFVDTLTKCGIDDGECQRALYQKVMRSIGKSGIPDLGIPPIDPIDLKNISVSVLELVNITMVDGIAKGFKDCVFNSFTTDIKKEYASMDITCDATIKGQYKVSSSPLIKDLLGGNTVHGEGFGKVRLEKIHIKFDYFFYAQKRDGEIYLKCKLTEMKYKYEILGKTTFAADNIYLGNQKVSSLAINFLNENWKFVMSTFGKAFMDKAMEYVYVYTHKFFDAVPTKYYISDDLTPYVRD